MLQIPNGVVEIITIFTGTWLAKRWRNGLVWVSCIYFVPNIVGAFLLIFLPQHLHLGRLISIYGERPLAHK